MGDLLTLLVLSIVILGVVLFILLLPVLPLIFGLRYPGRA